MGYNHKTKQELKHGHSKAATFHAACVQLVSLNFALHEARYGTHIATEPVRMRSRRKQFNAVTLERLRDMYYSSVKEGAEALGCMKTDSNKSYLKDWYKAMENSAEKKCQVKDEFFTETSGKDSGINSTVTSQ